MPDEKKADDVEKLLSEQKLLDDRKQALVDDLLRQKAEAVKAFDEKLAKIGYHADGKPKKSHHRQAGTETAGSPKGKTKA